MRTYFGTDQKATTYRLQFVFLFLGFGCLIALFVSLLNFRLDTLNIRQAFKDAVVAEMAGKQRELYDFTEMLRNYVVSLRDSEALEDYIQNPTKASYEQLNSFFFSIARSNPQLMQVRFIDSNGMEEVRVDYPQQSSTPIIIARDKLQNKQHRYYFSEASKVAVKSYWYSHLDLNIENNEIEVPLKPVLRAASPVYNKGEFRGIVIVNVYAQRLLDSLRESSFFNVSIIDHEGEFIIHYDDIHSWSRYLAKEYTIFDELPEHAADIVAQSHQQEIFSFGSMYLASLGSLLPQDMAFLLIYPKKSALERMQRENRKATVFVVAIILCLSIPLAILLSQVPVRLNRKIAEQNKTLSEYVRLVDENILTTTTDNEHRITSVSSAYSAMCGYSKEELYGKSYSVLKGGSADVYSSVREQLRRGKVWQGELLLRTKDNIGVWTEAMISPRTDKEGEITYWAIYEDITSKKELELKAITDELTGLFNRRHFNSILKQELNRARRHETVLCFAILDVDHFKQYNDNYGHQKGDAVLEAIGQLLNSKLNRAGDFTFRLGGEEFGLLFSGYEGQGAVEFAESIRSAIGELQIEHSWSKVAPVITASMGLLCVLPGIATTMDEIYRIGDEALYKAKGLGRNTLFVTSIDAKLK